MRRHNDAIGIQQGACNPSGIARSLVAACDECRANGVPAATDAAVRLIAHQLAFLCDTHALDGTDTYSALLRECEAQR